MSARAEVESRVSIYMEQYSMKINVEAGVMIDMADKLIYPAGSEYATVLAESINALKSAGSKITPVAQLENLDDVVNAIEDEQAVAFKEKAVEYSDQQQ